MCGPFSLAALNRKRVGSLPANVRTMRTIKFKRRHCRWPDCLRDEVEEFLPGENIDGGLDSSESANTQFWTVVNLACLRASSDDARLPGLSYGPYLGFVWKYPKRPKGDKKLIDSTELRDERRILGNQQMMVELAHAIILLRANDRQTGNWPTTERRPGAAGC